MFTGLVEEVGRIASAERAGGVLRVRVDAPTVAADLALGDSVAVSGCCLTAVAVTEAGFEAEATDETLRATAPRWHEGAAVNLERALPASGRFGGHVVSGHVEGTGEVIAREDRGGAVVLTVRAPRTLARLLVPKGSVTVDGVSLTLVDVGGPGGSRDDLAPHEFTLWIIPHTLDATTLGELRPGDRVNLEADLLARYAERASLLRDAPPAPASPEETA